MYLAHNIHNDHARNHSAFSKRISDNHLRKGQVNRLNLKLSNSKTTLEICPSQKSESQANQTMNIIAFAQDMQSPRASQFHIKTFIRFRPFKIINDSNLNNLSQGNMNKKVAIIDKKKILCEDNFFAYDHVFEPISHQQEIYNCVCKQMVQHFVRGFNSTVFAYGQTGSGKTHTMFGELNEQSKKGIIPSAIRGIFTSVKGMSNEGQQNKQLNNEVILSCSMLEIYKETMIDLLTNQKADLKIKQNQFFNVSNLTIKQVGNQQEMLQVLKLGNQSKKIRQTNMNQASSRSHVIFSIYLQVRKQHQKRLSKFNLVDLAGSQKVSKSKVEGQGLEQAKKINLSLSCLGNTINALLKRNDHIPYRQSKLTRLLYESLGGNSLTRLIVTCSSEDSQIQETLSSLKFASRAKNLKTNPLINTLRKSEKSVSRIVYENLKTNLNKAQNKIKKIKNYLHQLKNDNSNQKNDIQSGLNKQNKSLVSNTQSQSSKQKDPKLLSKLNFQLDLYKRFTEKIDLLLQPSNKDLHIQLSQKPLKSENLYTKTLSEPFLLISYENETNPKNFAIQHKDGCQKSRDFDNKQLNLLKQSPANYEGLDYWQIIKTQQKQISLLKNYISKLDSQTIDFVKEEDQTKKFKNYNDLMSTQACSRRQTRKNSNFQIFNQINELSQLSTFNQVDEKNKKCRKLNIKVSGKFLPVRQIFLTSPTAVSSFKGKLKFSVQKNASSSNRVKIKSQVLTNKQSHANSPREFMPTQYKQQSLGQSTDTILKQINKKLQHRNQYQKFQKNVLLRQLQIMFNQKQRETSQNQGINKDRISKIQSQKQKILYSQTNQLLISQTRYIQQLEQILTQFSDKKFQTLNSQDNLKINLLKQKLNAVNLR